MSRRPISLSPDLKQLQDQGYDVGIEAGLLVIREVPYVTASQEVKRGVLVSGLELAGDVAQPPSDHVAKWSGDAPCDAKGRQLEKIYNSATSEVLPTGLEINHIFSSKPPQGYRDYHHKMTTYEDMISRHARAIDPDATSKVFPVIPDEDEASVFNYIDTASSRAGISVIADKLKIGPIAIVGLGGTGSYVLDLVAKTPVAEIHLFDGDRFDQHNAFRSPGGPSIETLQEKRQKVEHFAAQYSGMRKGIIAHDYYVDESNVAELREMDFVFLSLDNGDAKRVIVSKLEDYGVPFIDVGMGVFESDGSLSGSLRTTTSTPDQREHVHDRRLIPFSDGAANNEYSQNIQIADLNALNAALAVLRWKKLVGFYTDLGKEHNSVYTTSDNYLINEDCA
jgi:hypothetical protein